MHKFITVKYDLFSTDAEGKRELLEQADQEHPFQFISELGMALDAFERNVAELEAGSEFNFTVSPAEGYGEYDPERVINAPKSAFYDNGRFMADRVYKGAIIPLVNADGYHFYGLVVEIGDEFVRLDCNNLYAGKTLNYIGTVLESRPATDAEVTTAIQGYGESEGGCGGCGGCGGGSCGGGCGEGGCGGCGCH